jgi:hypothetical protein
MSVVELSSSAVRAVAWIRGMHWQRAGLGRRGAGLNAGADRHGGGEGGCRHGADPRGPRGRGRTWDGDLGRVHGDAEQQAGLLLGVAERHRLELQLRHVAQLVGARRGLRLQARQLHGAVGFEELGDLGDGIPIIGNVAGRHRKADHVVCRAVLGVLEQGQRHRAACAPAGRRRRRAGRAGGRGGGARGRGRAAAGEHAGAQQRAVGGVDTELWKGE